MMLEPEYYLFTKEDPLKPIKDEAKKLSMPRKIKFGPQLRRTEVLIKKSKDFRTILLNDEADLANVIGAAFMLYFDAKIDKGRLVAIPRDCSIEFMAFFNHFCKSKVENMDDKYMKKANSLILKYSESIDFFIKAFHSIRTIKTQLNKLQTQ